MSDYVYFGVAVFCFSFVAGCHFGAWLQNAADGGDPPLSARLRDSERKEHEDFLLPWIAQDELTRKPYASRED